MKRLLKWFENFDLDDLVDKLYAVVVAALKYVVAPLVLIVAYWILVTFLGDLGYMILFVALLVTIYALVLTLRNHAARLSSVNWEKMARDLSTHLGFPGQFHLAEADWNDLRRQLPTDISGRIDALESSKRWVESLELGTKLHELDGLLNDLTALNTTVTVDQDKKIAAINLSQQSIAARIDAVEKLEKSVRDLAQNLKTVLEELQTTTLPDAQKAIDGLRSQADVDRDTVAGLAQTLAALQKTVQDLGGKADRIEQTLADFSAKKAKGVK